MFRRLIRSLAPCAFLLGLTACGSNTDIAITGGSYLPVSPTEGGTLNVTVQVKNLGNTSVQDVVISVFFGIGGTAHALPDHKLPRVSLAPGASSSVTVSWDLLPGWGNKDVTIWGEADVSRSFIESDEANNRFDLGTVRIAPASAFACQGNSMVLSRFQNQTYQCFDVRVHSQNAVSQQLAGATRLLLYGTYAVIDCPVSQLSACYEHVDFANKTQHEVQTNNVGASPVIFFDTPLDPWNLVYVGVYATMAELQADCGPGANACAWGFRIAITEQHLTPVAGITGISAGGTNYYFSVQRPSTCKDLEFHEYQHAIDRGLLKPHASWLEEMLARLFAEHLHFLRLMCPAVQFTNMSQVSGGVSTPLSTPPDLRQINSNRPLDNFGTFYSAGDTCKEAIIMQMNRGALAQGQAYLRKLFQLMRVEAISTDHEVARVILLSSNSDPAVSTFLIANGCQP